MAWEITKNRFLSFLDFMGFKEFVLKNPHDEVFKIMNEISGFVKSINSAKLSDAFKNKKAFTINFSDSIFLFSEDDSQESFEIFTMANFWLFGHIISRSIPLKGAIAYGLISVDIDNQLYFGQPIIDSYQLQDEIFYYGIVAHHSFEKNLINYKQNNVKALYFEAKTPLKSGSIEHVNLDWSLGYKIAMEKKGDKIDLIEKIKSFRTQASGYPRKYIDNTLELFNQKITTTNKPAKPQAGAVG
jgi:hypothetical protein